MNGTETQEALRPFKTLLDEYPAAADDDYVTSTDRLSFGQIRKLIAAFSTSIANEAGGLTAPSTTACDVTYRRELVPPRIARILGCTDWNPAKNDVLET